jgi:sirohydrochlorin ferrochelatase
MHCTAALLALLTIINIHPLPHSYFLVPSYTHNIIFTTDRIVCFPFFLSPGKHAMEDVPQLVEEARVAIKNDPFLAHLSDRIDIVLTQPLGSNTSILIDAMSRIIDDTIKQPGTFRTQEQQDGLGFFGDIMRMMEEQENGDAEETTEQPAAASSTTK